MHTRKRKLRSKRYLRTLRRVHKFFSLMKEYHEKNYKYVPKSLAILIIGRIKGYTHVKDKLLNLQKKYHAKMFCSLNKKGNSEYIQKFRDTYDVKDGQIHLEHIPPPEYIGKYRITVPLIKDNMYSCCYHKQKCFELMERYQEDHNMKFECILYYRADIDEFEELKFEPLEDNTVFIPVEKYPHIRDTGGINDQIAYGNHEGMKKYCGIVNSLKEICDEEGVLYHPELLLKKYVERVNLLVKRIPYDYMLHPERHAHLAEYDDHE